MTLLNLLVDSGGNAHILDIVLAIGCVKHLRGIIWVLFLGDAHINADVGIAKRIILEGDCKLSIFC